jgi:hypothetical protein
LRERKKLLKTDKSLDMKVREVKNTEKIKERERIHEQKVRDRFTT